MMRKNTIFQSTPTTRQKRSAFDLSHEVKMTGKFANLMPIMCHEVVPGDVFRDTTTCYFRVAPQLAPVMHRVNAKMHYFMVPSRLLCSFWPDFITGGRDGEWAAGVVPFVTPASFVIEGRADLMQKGTVWDYLGLPVWDGVNPASPNSTERISILPMKAWAKIFNDYYRDPNFTDEIELSVDGGGDQTALAITLLTHRQRAWAKDYFTAALAQAQRGPSVLIPMDATGVTDPWDPVTVGTVDDGDPLALGDTKIGNVGLQQFLQDSAGTTVGLGSVGVTVSNTQITINDFRTALAIQKWMEVNARSGYEYIDQILAHFGERVPDYRLQRAEYISGSVQPVQFSEVVATAKTEVDASVTPVGDLSGYASSVGKASWSYKCSEHGFIIGVLSVGPEPAYQQGLHRMWTRQDRFDYLWPEFAHLGEQEILNKEVYYDFAAAEDDANNDPFGYIPRYAEYKYSPDRVAGDFRDTMAYWHLGRIFLTRPSLDAFFTTMSEDGMNGMDAYEESMRRIFAVQDGTDYLWINLFHNTMALRPLPYFGVPKIVG